MKPMNLLKYFAVSPASEPLTDGDEIRKRYARLRWSVFLSATLGYGLYYVCRLSLNVIKKPIVDAGVLSEAELGIIGSGLFVTYAVGKLTNGFLADRSNIRRFLAAGLLLTAFINLVLGFTTSFAVFLVLWAVNGWAQSMGAAPCVVALSRWFGDRERGTFYGLWSSSHNIGEAITFIATAVIVAAWGWQWGFRGAGLLGLLGFLLVVLFMRDTPQSCGLPSVAHYKGDETPERVAEEGKSVGELQKEVLRNPAIWMLALASALCREQLGHLLPRSGQGLYESRSQFRDFDQFGLRNRRNRRLGLGVGSLLFRPKASARADIRADERLRIVALPARAPRLLLARCREHGRLRTGHRGPDLLPRRTDGSGHRLEKSIRGGVGRRRDRQLRGGCSAGRRQWIHNPEREERRYCRCRRKLRFFRRDMVLDRCCDSLRTLRSGRMGHVEAKGIVVRDKTIRQVKRNPSTPLRLPGRYKRILAQVKLTMI